MDRNLTVSEWIIIDFKSIMISAKAQSALPCGWATWPHPDFSRWQGVVSIAPSLFPQISSDPATNLGSDVLSWFLKTGLKIKEDISYPHFFFLFSLFWQAARNKWHNKGERRDDKKRKTRESDVSALDASNITRYQRRDGEGMSGFMGGGCALLRVYVSSWASYHLCIQDFNCHWYG